LQDSCTGPRARLDQPPYLDATVLRQYWRISEAALKKLKQATLVAATLAPTRARSLSGGRSRMPSLSGEAGTSAQQAFFSASAESSMHIAVRTAGQVFAGAKAWTGRVTEGWELPVQAAAALAVPNEIACVLVVPQAVILEAVRCMERTQIVSLVDQFCRASSLRHVGVSELVRMASSISRPCAPASCAIAFDPP